MSRLRLSVLGVPEAHLLGEAIVFRTRKTLALLIYLAVEGGFQPRDKLIALLWPESDARRGRMSLRRALASLRKTLGDTDPRNPATILVQGDTLCFNPTADLDLDTTILETASRQARSPGSAVLPGDLERQETFQAAVALYRGDFLEGFTLKDAGDFDQWVSLQREFYHRQMEQLLDCLSHLQLESGELSNAIQTSQRWTQHSSLNEAAYRRLMQVCFAAGDRSAALEAYERCARMLEKELGLEPSPETKAFAERFRETPPLAMPTRRGAEVASQALSTLLGRPFVGRTAEYGRLVELYHAVQRGQARVVVIVGETGIGKTRLALEFSNWAAAQGAQVLTGRAFQTAGKLSYQPWMEILRCRAVQEALSQNLLSAVWLGELSRLLPELIDVHPGISPLNVDELEAQVRLFQSVVNLCDALATRGPMVIFFDDLQWADLASLDLLQYASRRWLDSDKPVLLLLCLRTGAVTARGPMSEWLINLDRTLMATRIELRPLTDNDTRQWVQFLGERGTHESEIGGFSEWLHTETGGHPFYIRAMLDALLERGVVVAHPAKGDRWIIEFRDDLLDRNDLRGFMPPGVREVILARLTPLTPHALEMLNAAAILGHRLNFEHLCQLAGLEQEDGLRALDQLIASRLLQEQLDDEDRSKGRSYMFAHDKIRDVVYQEAGAARRRILHSRALKTLTHASVSAAELAHHAYAAGELEIAFSQSVTAGGEALELVATQDALAHFAQAHEVLQRTRLEGVERQVIVRLYIDYGRSLELESRFVEAQAIYEELEALGRQYGDREMELASLMANVTLHATPTSVSNPDKAQHLSKRALALARNLNDQRSESKLLWSLSHVYRVSNRMSEAIDAGERSLALARSQNLREQMAFSLNDLGSHCYFMSGRVDQAKIALHEASELWRELSNLPMLVDSLASLALASSFCGEYEQVLALSEEAVQISQSTSNLWGQAFSRMQVGTALWERGQSSPAITAMEVCIRLSESAGFNVPQALTRADMAEAYGCLGAIERGLGIARLALSAAETSLLHSNLYVLAVIARLHMMDENLSDAEMHVEQAKRDPNLETVPLFFLRVLLAECELALRLRDYERALTVSNGLLAKLAQFDIQAYLPRAQFYRGQTLFGLDQAEAALEQLHEARVTAEAIGSRQVLWPILLTLSQQERDPGEADNLRAQARAIVLYIRDQTTSPELQASYSGLPGVRELLDDQRKNHLLF